MLRAAAREAGAAAARGLRALLHARCCQHTHVCTASVLRVRVARCSVYDSNYKGFTDSLGGGEGGWASCAGHPLLPAARGTAALSAVSCAVGSAGAAGKALPVGRCARPGAGRASERCSHTGPGAGLRSSLPRVNAASSLCVPARTAAAVACTEHGRPRPCHAAPARRGPFKSARGRPRCSRETAAEHAPPRREGPRTTRPITPRAVCRPIARRPAPAREGWAGWRPPPRSPGSDVTGPM